MAYVRYLFVFIYLFTFKIGIFQMDIWWQRFSLGIFRKKLKCILMTMERHYRADKETGLNFRGLVKYKSH